jgi:hypothetical protein
LTFSVSRRSRSADDLGQQPVDAARTYRPSSVTTRSATATTCGVPAETLRRARCFAGCFRHGRGPAATSRSLADHLAIFWGWSVITIASPRLIAIASPRARQLACARVVPRGVPDSAPTARREARRSPSIMGLVVDLEPGSSTLAKSTCFDLRSTCFSPTSAPKSMIDAPRTAHRLRRAAGGGRASGDPCLREGGSRVARRPLGRWGR